VSFSGCRRITTVLSISGLLAASAGAQQLPHVGEWQVVTDMRNARAVSTSTGGVWVATEGGLYRREGDGTFSLWTVANGLPSNDLTALVTAPDGALLIGSQDGYVSIRSASTGAFRTIDDIALSTRVQKGIRSFYAEEDSILIGSDFGISVFLVSRDEFGDTYANFGFAATARVQSIIIHNGRIWAATSEGVATALRSAPNLAAPTSWTTFTAAGGLPSKNALSVSVLNDTVVVGTSSGMAFFDGTSFQPMAQAQASEVTHLQVQAQSLLALWNQGGVLNVGSLSSLSGSLSVIASASGSGRDLAVNASDGSKWIATSSQGALRWDGSTWETVRPNGPASNLFISLAVDRAGVLWCGTGANTSGQGFYRYDPSRTQQEQWKNFQVSEYVLMGSNDYYKASAGADGRMWISSWGWGVVEIVADTIHRVINSTTTPKLMGAVPQNTAFVVAGSVAPGPDGAEWFIARSAVDGNYIAHFVNDTTFEYFTNSVTPGEGRFTSMVIDQYGTKWLANAEPFNKPGTGLYFFNENKQVPGTQYTNGWGLVTQADGLPNMTVLSLSVDREGEIWVGTDLGVMIITDPLYPKQRNLRSFPLREQIIQTIVVDGVNNKWVGTKEGIFVVSPDGSQLLQQYTVTSTGGKLLSNDVRSLAIDQGEGILYVGTEKGLSMLGIAPVATVRSYTSLQLGPNPYRVPQEQNLTIRDLVPETTIKILRVDGSLVSEFKAQGGGRAFWDGRDQSGELVSSGVYFVVAYADDGNQVTTGKVAVIRQ
jgi:ligand-binding sensor domain-containing protein